MNSLNLFAKQTDLLNQLSCFQGTQLWNKMKLVVSTTGNPANAVLCLRVQDISSTEQGIS